MGHRKMGMIFIWHKGEKRSEGYEDKTEKQEALWKVEVHEES